jgi:hypothetical protein
MKSKKVIDSIICSLYLMCIGLSFGLFCTPPSLAYLAHYYIAVGMFFFSILQLIGHKKENKLKVGLITLTPIAVLLLILLNARILEDQLIILGQISMGGSFLIGLYLFRLIWK